MRIECLQIFRWLFKEFTIMLIGEKMKFGILTRNEESWCSVQLKKAFQKRGIITFCFNYSSLVARVGLKPNVSSGKTDILKSLEAIIARPIGRGSLEEIIFRMDLLHRLERFGIYIFNSPSAIERSVDKYYSLTLLEESGLSVPKTIVAENTGNALKAFKELGGDIVVKPIFGSCGKGSTRISDPDIAERIFRAINFQHEVMYLQEFIPHNNEDIRILVLGDRVLASMRRVADSWKTNVSLGAKPIPYTPSRQIEKLALEATKIIGCDLAGVDILDIENPTIIELNSQPGWKGLQAVNRVNIADMITEYIISRINKLWKD